MLRAYVYNITNKQSLLVHKMLASELSSDPIKITDLKSFQPIYSPGDYVIAYGNHARRCCESLGIPYLSLPDVHKLDPFAGNYELRNKVHHILSEFKKTLDKEKVDPSNAIGLTAEGFAIKFSNEPDKRGEDINMTYRELDLMNLAVGVLGIRNFSFVRDNNDSSKGTD